MPISIKIPNKIIKEIIELSENAFPNEFFAYLEGRITMSSVVIKNLAYYPNDTSATSVATIYHMGTYTADFVGTVHSHPGGSNHPSRADISTFNKHGIAHFIIKSPFVLENMKCYGPDGNEMEFEVLDK